VLYALRNVDRRRRLYPTRLARYDHIRLRSPRAVDPWLAETVRDTVSQAVPAPDRLREVEKRL
jgi:hypothetical protein